MYSSIFELIAAMPPGDIAIGGIGKAPMTYGQLRRQIEASVGSLHMLGYSRRDRIAVMLPNGPEIAAAFLSIAAGFACAPLNPSYREKELGFYLSDMHASALVLPPDAESDIVAVAGSLGIPIVILAPEGDTAGTFRIDGEKIGPASEDSYASHDDIALVLHTSGTTSRPKLVPLRHASILSSARDTAGPLALTREDRCLNVMPLFHVHGLVGAVLASLVAGGSVICASGFRPEHFTGWLRQYRPTWYTAVPTIHQKVLEQALAYPDHIRGCSLRFIRSSSAAMPPVVMRGLEDAFDVPVIEAFGMTESPHQISTNPLPPKSRKQGSVGQATGVEIAIIDDAWQFLPVGVSGEIALRGQRIISGYENNIEANIRSFKDGWFRTGDRGYLDEDRYLFIDGRIKEIINRGGEKIAPREIEEVLLTHPMVAEAAVFSVPDASLGESVGAAIVLKAGASILADDLRRYVSGSLAYFKVPARIWLVDAIPKGPTGKVQRIGMYERIMAMSAHRAGKDAPVYEAPATATELLLADIWSQVLHIGRIGRHDSFLDLAGDSLLATQVISRVNEAFGVSVPIVRMMDSDTIALLGETIEEIAHRKATGSRQAGISKLE